MTQNEQVLYHLEKVGSITAAEAMTRYGIGRLAARIADLRDKGIRIKSETVEVVTRWGKKGHYARYTLEPRKDD